MTPRWSTAPGAIGWGTDGGGTDQIITCIDRNAARAGLDGLRRSAVVLEVAQVELVLRYFYYPLAGITRDKDFLLPRAECPRRNRENREVLFGSQGLYCEE